MSFTRIFRLARYKISGTEHVDNQVDLRSALLCRLALGFSRTYKGTRLAEEMVRGKMAQVLYVPEHREYLHATYGSEYVQQLLVPDKDSKSDKFASSVLFWHWGHAA